MLGTTELADQRAVIDEAGWTLRGYSEDDDPRRVVQRKQLHGARRGQLERAEPLVEPKAKRRPGRRTLQRELRRRGTRRDQLTLGDDARSPRPHAQQHEREQVEEGGQPKHTKP